jgi:membrane protease YdiL (CAAX protease family)
MSENSSKEPVVKRSLRAKVIAAIVFPAWVFLGFTAAQLVVVAAYRALLSAGVPFDQINTAVLETSLGGIIYALTLLIVIGVPWVVAKYKTTLQEIGLGRLVNWKDIGVAPLGFAVYFILSGILLVVAQNYLPFVDIDQAQNVGFDQVTSQWELVLAFLMLVIIAPIAEEILFRGYLFSKLRTYIPLWVAIIITSALFGAVHGQWNVAIDTFALSVIMCLAVVWTKSLWPAILIHMLKNGIAFYFLFINPIV